MTAVGIDAIEIWTGKLKLDLPETVAPVKDKDPAYYTKGFGLNASSFPDAYEDIVTMGANAAHRLMERKGLTPDDIGRIDVATESAFDNSKPVSTYIAGCLEQVYDGDFHHANKGERKFACIAGTQSLDDAYNWIKAGRNRGRSALVIATDTALYARGDPGEATQGAGAVAMLISEDPSIVELSTEQGYGSADETDFLKPNQQFPSVDGKRSMQVYLARMREALEDFERAGGETHPDDYVFGPFHTPFPGMVRKAGLFALPSHDSGHGHRGGTRRRNRPPTARAGLRRPRAITRRPSARTWTTSRRPTSIRSGTRTPSNRRSASRVKSGTGTPGRSTSPAPRRSSTPPKTTWRWSARSSSSGPTAAVHRRKSTPKPSRTAGRKSSPNSASTSRFGTATT